MRILTSMALIGIFGMSTVVFAQDAGTPAPSAPASAPTSTPTPALVITPVESVSTPVAATPSAEESRANKKRGRNEAKVEGKRACRKIAQACQKAGYTKGNHKKKKGLAQDCMRPVLEGSKIPGVTVASADVFICKNFRQSKGHKK